MPRPFETNIPSAASSPVPASTERVIRVLRQAADDLEALRDLRYREAQTVSESRRRRVPSIWLLSTGNFG